MYIADWADDEVRMVAGYPCASSCPFGLPFLVEGDIYTVAHARKVFGVALDSLGNLYITDTIAGTVEEVARSDGQVSVVAGTGALCSSPTSPCGDGGPATSASLDLPVDTLIGPRGSLYIADSEDYRVRIVPGYSCSSSCAWGLRSFTGGYIYTIAGTGAYGCSPPTSSCGDGGKATGANLSGPEGLAFGPEGNLYIADSEDNRIRKVTRSGDIIETVAGNGVRGSTGDGGPATSAELDFPHSVVLDSSGNLYISEGGSNQVQEVTRSTGKIETVAGNGVRGFTGDGGPATSAELANPFGLGIGAHGHIYIADDGNNRIQVMTPEVALAPVREALGDGPSVVSNADICTSGDAVICSTGDFNLSSTDFSIKGFGAGLSLTRTYNSTDASDSSIFGYGWTSSYSMSLHVESNGDVEVGQPGGSLVTFTPGSTPGTYTAPPYVFASLSKSPSGTFSYIVRGHGIYSFSPSGSLISISDPNGSATTLSYSPGGKLASLTDASGRSLNLSYNPSGFVSSVTDPMGRTWEYAYNPSGDLVSATNPTGGTWDFTYSPPHLLLSVTDPMGGTTRNTYNTSGQVISQVDPAGEATTYSYFGDPFSSGGGTTTITGPTGIRETQTYTLGTLTSLTRDAGTREASTWRYTIDPATLSTTSVTNPTGDTTRFSYDSSGNMASVTDPLGRTWRFTYNSFGEVTTVTNPAGGVTTSTYDASGNLTSTREELSPGVYATTTYIHGNPARPGEVTAVKNPDGHSYHFTYDPYGNLDSMTTPPGYVTSYSYNADSELLTTTSPRGNLAGADKAAYTTSYTYSPLGKEASVENPLGEVTTYSYNEDGELTGLSAPDGATTTYTYSPLGALSSVTNPLGQVTSYSYGPRGHLVKETSSLGQSTTYSFNGAGELASTTNPLGEITSYAYDLAGRLVSVTSPGGRPTDMTYDAAGERTGLSYPGTTMAPSAFTYNPLGEIAKMVDATGVTTYTYDLAGRLTSSVDGAGAKLTYAYDPMGNVTSITYPNAKVVQQTYNASGEMSSVTDWLGNTTTFTYGPDANLDSTSYPNRVEGTATYNAAGKPTSISYAAKSCKAAPSYFLYRHHPCKEVANLHLSYSYNQENEVTSLLGSGEPPGGSSSYGYDLSGELTSATPVAPMPSRQVGLSPLGVGYSYNGSSQLSATTGPGALSSTLTYNPASELTGLEGSILGFPYMRASYTYNREGERTRTTTSGLFSLASSASYTYNPASEMDSYEGPQGGSPVSIQSAPMPSLLGPGRTTTESYTYNGAGLLSEISSGGSSSLLTWDTNEKVPELIGVGKSFYITGPAGLPIEEITASGSVLFYEEDALGSTRALTNKKGQVVARYSYSPYGQMTTASCTGQAPRFSGGKQLFSPGPILAKGSCPSNPFLYAGQFLDKASGLYYMRARWYDPKTAQFTSVDPLVALTNQPYSYAGNDPISVSDPTGLCGCSVAAVLSQLIPLPPANAETLLDAGITAGSFAVFTALTALSLAGGLGLLVALPIAATEAAAAGFLLGEGALQLVSCQ